MPAKTRNCQNCKNDFRIARWAKQMSPANRKCSRCGAGFRTPHRATDVPDILCKKCWVEATA